MKKDKRVRNRHVFWKWFYDFPSYLYCKARLGWNKPKRYRLDKKKGAIILSNHQTDFDPIMIAHAFNRPLYYVCTDSVFSRPLLTWFINHSFAVIPKKKGASDAKCVRGIMQTVKEGGVVCLFPEGNRTMAEFQFEIDPSISKLVKKMGVDLVLFNFYGGTSVFPRFAPKQRRGKITGKVVRVVKPDEYENMSDDELTNLIKENLREFDTDLNLVVKTTKPAEYLERILFVCPKCGHVQTIYSLKDHVKCSNCGLDMIYDQSSHFFENEFGYHKLIDWYNYQKDFVRNMEIGDGVIFSDTDVKFYLANPYHKRELISSGKVTLYKDKLVFDNFTVDIKDITSASVVSGKKMSFSFQDNEYLVVGHDRFNALKYVFLFNKLDTEMKKNHTDHFYNLD